MRPHRLVLSLSTLLASLALVSTTTPAARAEVWSHRDASRDVVRVVQSGDGGSREPAPDDTRTDIRRVVIAHTDRVVRVVARIPAMRAGNQLGLLSLRVPGGRELLGELVRDDGRTRFALMPWTDDEMEACEHATGRFRPKRNVMVVRVPRSCLGDPSWVRVSVLYGTFDETLTDADEFRVDDGLRDRGYVEGRPPVWSPRVAVG